MTIPPDPKLTAHEGTLPNHVSRLERGLAVAIIVCAGGYYLSLPLNLYPLIGVFNTELINRGFAVLAGLLGLVLGGLYILLYEKTTLKRILFIILFILTAIPLMNIGGLAAIAIDLLLAAVGMIPLLILLAILIVLWLLRGDDQPERVLYFLRITTLLIAASAPLYIVYAFVLYPHFTIEDEMRFADHHYYLVRQWKMGDSIRETTLLLFECDSSARNCLNVYASDVIEDGESMHFTMIANAAAEVVSIYQNELKIKIYRPGSGKPLGNVFFNVWKQPE